MKLIPPRNPMMTGKKIKHKKQPADSDGGQPFLFTFLFRLQYYTERGNQNQYDKRRVQIMEIYRFQKHEIPIRGEIPRT